MNQFVKTLLPLARLCLLVALMSFAIGVYAWHPLAQHATWTLFPMHLVVMAVLLCVLFQLAKCGFSVLGRRDFAFPRVSFPRAYWLAVVISFVWFLAVFVGAINYYPRGMDLGRVVYLRIFSSGWLFLSLCAGGFAQWAGLCLRALKATV
ncbi:hypothetical protein V1318_02465 [Lysobacter sp. CCNWLW3]|uniref:hypothetical protein n=1 Tax=unclassified Lysobacter TaxID=2635362 RepID=UPI002FD55BCE